MRILIAIVTLITLTAAPASAQMFFGQGPWNQLAQQSVSKPARGAPPRNAQCGWYMGKVTGHTRRSLWLAQNWAREFPRTSPRPGAVVVWNRGGSRGHVAQIVEMSSQNRCRATVHDNRGTYQRDICRGVMAYVSVR